ncbi:hypothetical protein [Micromonospora auratinigra]|uniref:Uncharacterized protein n=1 Tax=Micromonospora auratinigra TaxID=261654 RepID=A0A1A8Z3A3_9ACTN|nr:hypothetical protein [Micromonospora auratinigra]SBT38348.1 hypothetical protein GA0070611_0517 [Micromonospora auratinigra]
MEGLFGVAVAVFGVYVLCNVRRFVDGSARTSRDVFGVELPRGSRRERAHGIWVRTITVVVAVAMVVGGLVQAFAPHRR